VKRGGQRGQAATVCVSPPSLFSAELFAALGLDELIPPALARWRPLVADGLRFFVEHLPVAWQAELIAAQLQLATDETADASRRLVALLAQCPTLHKLGQVVARHPRLDARLRHQLQTLESLPPSDAAAQQALRIRIQAELSGMKNTGSIELAEAALAQGSVAVVWPFVCELDGVRAEGVFKVLKPDIEARLAAELKILIDLAPYLEARARALALPPLDYRDTLANVERLMMREVRLEVEQHNLAAATNFYADEPFIQVPRLLPWCTPRMTAMERIYGCKLTQVDLPPVQRRRLADALISALLGQPFWSYADQAVVHADLHAGNLFFTDDGRIAVLDWSLTAALGKEQREALVAIVLGGLLLDAQAIRQAVALLADVAHDDPLLAGVVDAALDRLVQQPRLPGFEWLLELFDELALHATVSFWEDFVLLRKSWLSLTGVIHDLAGEVPADAPLIGLALQRFAHELPARALAAPASPAFATHVSNLDLLRVCASPWLVSLRWWERCWRMVWAAAESARAGCPENRVNT
jgi:ubiquinone biosynthesis protein